jgi:hypothetical protein
MFKKRLKLGWTELFDTLDFLQHLQIEFSRRRLRILALQPPPDKANGQLAGIQQPLDPLTGG